MLLLFIVSLGDREKRARKSSTYEYLAKSAASPRAEHEWAVVKVKGQAHTATMSSITIAGRKASSDTFWRKTAKGNVVKG